MRAELACERFGLRQVVLECRQHGVEVRLDRSACDRRQQCVPYRIDRGSMKRDLA